MVAEKRIFSAVLWLPRTYSLEVNPDYLWQKAASNYLEICMCLRCYELLICLLQTEVTKQRPMKNKTKETNPVK